MKLGACAIYKSAEAFKSGSTEMFLLRLKKPARHGFGDVLETGTTHRAMVSKGAAKKVLSQPLLNNPPTASLRQHPAECRADTAREEQRQRQKDAAARCHPRRERGAGDPNDNTTTTTTTPVGAASISSPGRGGIGERGGSSGRSSSAKRRSSKAKVFHCREAELLPEVYARLDSGDWRERLKGLEEV